MMAVLVLLLLLTVAAWALAGPTATVQQLAWLDHALFAQARPQGTTVTIKMPSQLGNGVTLAFMHHIGIVMFVIGLLFWQCPHAVFLGIIAVVIQALNRMLQVGTWAHVREKLLERLPFYADTSAAIRGILWKVGVCTSGLHHQPATIGGGAGHPMRCMYLTRSFFLQTSATLYSARQQVGSVYKLFCAALATTQPTMFATRIIKASDKDGQTAKWGVFHKIRTCLGHHASPVMQSWKEESGNSARKQRVQPVGLAAMLLYTICCIFSSLIFPQIVQSQGVRAFPTAEGYGANTVGGRGGSVCKVTSLANSGANTLRDCLENRSGPRMILFDVSGTIVLDSHINVSDGYITIAGQTSPGGVQIKSDQVEAHKFGLQFLGGSHNIIIRHLRVRPGFPNEGNANQGILFYSNVNPPIHDVILDHVSSTWDPDGIQTYGEVDNVTFQWSLFADALDAGYGTGIGHGPHFTTAGGNNPGKLSFHHNVIANCGSRAPWIMSNSFDMRNNIIYNWYGNNGTLMGNFSLNGSARGNVVNNWWIKGASGNTPVLTLSNVATSGSNRHDGSPTYPPGGTLIYSSGNWGFPGCTSGCADDYNTMYAWYDTGLPDYTAPPAQARTFTPYATPPVTTHDTSLLQSILFPTIGASKPSRDSADTNTINSVINNTGDLMSFGNGGPWPVLAGGTAPLDSDGDGIPDAWEDSHGLGKNNPNDGKTIITSGPNTGYSNLEVYLNELAGDTVPVGLVATQVEFGVQPGNTVTGTVLTPAITVRTEDGLGTLVSSTSNVSIALAGMMIPQASVTAVSADSTQPGYPITNAVDNNINTGWHSQFSAPVPSLPHSIIITFPSSTVKGFVYTPRPGPDTSGQVIGYNVYVSTDGTTWGSAVATGTFGTQHGGKQYGITFTPQVGSFLKFEGTSEIEGFQMSSAAELNVIITTAVVLGGTTTKAAVGGIATFDTITVPTAGVRYVLQATSAGLTSQLSIPFTVTDPVVIPPPTPEPTTLLRYVPGR